MQIPSPAVLSVAFLFSVIIGSVPFFKPIKSIKKSWVVPEGLSSPTIDFISRQDARKQRRKVFLASWF